MFMVLLDTESMEEVQRSVDLMKDLVTFIVAWHSVPRIKSD